MTSAVAPGASLYLQDRFDALDTALNSHTVERQREIRALLNALIGRRHVFLHGLPGIGKSYLVDLLDDLIDGMITFSILMTRFTTPPEVFGPVSLVGLENDKFKRKIEGYLPTCHLAWIDEIFKANSSILNALLWGMNERKYRHDDEIIHIPLSTLVCASNEFPQGEELGALYDRIDVRIDVKPIRDPQRFKGMLRLTNDPRVPVVTWDEILQAQAEADEVQVPETVLDAMVELKRKLREEGIEPTDRRFRNSLSLIRASAWQDGRNIADVEDLRPLQNVMWDRPEQIATVDSIVLAIASPLDQECNSLLAEIDKLEERLNAIENDDDKQRKGTEIHTKLQKAKRELDGIEKRAGASRRRTAMTREVRERLLGVTQRVLREVFSLDPDEYLKGTGDA